MQQKCGTMAFTINSRYRFLLFLTLISLVIMYIITEEPVGLPIPGNCKRLDMALTDNSNLIIGEARFKVLRQYASKCFPLDWTIMIYKRETSSSEMDFKQGFGLVEFLGELVSKDQPSRSAIKVKLDSIDQQQTCAIIGNSGILENSGCGHEIDRDYTYVIRSNIAPIKNFEKDVGIKTDLTVLNYDILRTLYGVLSNTGDESRKTMFLERLKLLNDSIIWYHKGARTRFWAKNKLRYIAKELKFSYNLPIRIAYTYTQIEHLTKWFWSIDVPYTTTGLDMFSVATTFCREITLYGFYPFTVDDRGRPIHHHYYEDVIMDYDNHQIHNIPKEFSLLQQLDTMNILKLKTSPCNVQSTD